MPRCGKLGRDTWGFISQLIRKTVENVLNDPNYNVPRLYWETYHNFGKRVWGIMRHGGGQAEIDNVIKEYQEYGVNPNILRIIVDRLMPILSAWLVRLHHCWQVTPGL
jgi:hypothetical protein